MGAAEHAPRDPRRLLERRHSRTKIVERRAVVQEAKSVLRKTMPVARRVLNEGNDLMLVLSWAYAAALYGDTGATLDDLCKAVTTLEETAQTARRVLGGAHPDTIKIEKSLRDARAALHARETPPGSA